MFSLRRADEIVSTGKTRALTHYCDQPTASLQAVPDASRNCLSEGWWKGVTHLTIRLRFPSGELPIVGKALKAGDHPHSKPRHTYKLSRRGTVCDSFPVHSEAGPRVPRSRWTEVRPSMF